MMAAEKSPPAAVLAWNDIKPPDTMVRHKPPVVTVPSVSLYRMFAEAALILA